MRFLIAFLLMAGACFGQLKIVDKNGANQEFQYRSHVKSYIHVVDDAGGIPPVWAYGEDDNGIVDEPILGPNPFQLESGSQSISGAGPNSFFHDTIAMVEIGTTRPGDTTDDYGLTESFGWAYGPKYNSQPELSTSWTLGAGVYFDNIAEIKSGNNAVQVRSTPQGVQELDAYITCWDNNQDYTIVHGKLYLFLNLPDSDGWETILTDGRIFECHFPESENVLQATYEAQFDDIRALRKYYAFNHQDHENIPALQTEDTDILDSTDPNTYSITVDVVFKIEPGQVKRIWVTAGEGRNSATRTRPEIILQHPQEAGTDEKVQEVAISGYLKHVAYWDITE